MISNETFMVLFIVIILVYSLRFKFVSFMDDNFYIIIKPQIIGYIMGILLFILAIFGIFYNEGPGKLSVSFGNLEPKSNQKPHKYFDINTDGGKKERAFNEKSAD